MKIGIDCRLWDETGVGRYISNLAYNLNKIDSDHEYVLFVLSRDESRIKNQESRRNFKIVVANIRWHSLEEQFLFPEIIKKEQVDLMHFPYFSVPIFYNDPFVVTIHDLIIDHFPTGKASTLPLPLYYIKRVAYNYVLKSALRKSKAIIVPLECVKQDIKKKFPFVQDKTFVTKEGTDILVNGKSDVTNRQNKKYFLHVGNVYPHKNCEKLVDAFAMVLKENPELQLVFIGKDDYFMSHLRQYVRNHTLSESIIFTGKVSDEELGIYYQEAIALVLPSLMEGFGLPAIEAMQQSCLVLVADIPSLREVCEDAAVFFDPKHVAAIANAMEKAIQLPTKEKKVFTQKGLDICKQFSWKKMSQETMKIYESCSGV